MTAMPTRTAVPKGFAIELTKISDSGETYCPERTGHERLQGNRRTAAWFTTWTMMRTSEVRPRAVRPTGKNSGPHEPRRPVGDTAPRRPRLRERQSVG